ncbi:MAG: hypothetical protein ACKVE4_11945 [Dissulfuribacterales bacterium]
MQIEATYNKGRVELPEHLQFCRDVFKIRIDIPVEVIVKQAETDVVVTPSSGAFSIRRQLDDILGSMRDGKSGQSLTDRDYKDMWHAHLEEKYLHGK